MKTLQLTYDTSCLSFSGGANCEFDVPLLQCDGQSCFNATKDEPAVTGDCRAMSLSWSLSSSSSSSSSSPGSGTQHADLIWGFDRSNASLRAAAATCFGGGGGGGGSNTAASTTSGCVCDCGVAQCSQGHGTDPADPFQCVACAPGFTSDGTHECRAWWKDLSGPAVPGVAGGVLTLGVVIIIGLIVRRKRRRLAGAAAPPSIAMSKKPRPEMMSTEQDNDDDEEDDDDDDEGEDDLECGNVRVGQTDSQASNTSSASSTSAGSGHGYSSSGGSSQGSPARSARGSISGAFDMFGRRSSTSSRYSTVGSLRGSLRSDSSNRSIHINTLSACRSWDILVPPGAAKKEQEEQQRQQQQELEQQRRRRQQEHQQNLKQDGGNMYG